MKLNLCCGRDQKDGYINIDVLIESNMRFDVRKSLPFDKDSIGEIYCRDAINLFTPSEWEKMKKDWFYKLRKGGRVELICRDIDFAVKRFLNEKDGLYKWGWDLQCIYGGHDHEFDHFKNGFTFERLKKDVEEEGIGNIENKSTDEWVHLVGYKL